MKLIFFQKLMASNFALVYISIIVYYVVHTDAEILRESHSFYFIEISLEAACAPKPKCTGCGVLS